MGFLPRGKAAEMSVNHPLPSHTDVKERVEQYLYSPSGPSWPVTRKTLKCFSCCIYLNLTYFSKYREYKSF